MSDDRSNQRAGNNRANTTRNRRSSATKTETQLVSSTLMQLARLLQVGFGAAGAEIIQHNLKDDEFDAIMPGHKMFGVFAFAGVADFELATVVLDKEVMRFVNEVAAIIHHVCHTHGGAVNRSLGGAFLLVWKVRREQINRNQSASTVVTNANGSKSVRGGLNISQAQFDAAVSILIERINKPNGTMVNGKMMLPNAMSMHNRSNTMTSTTFTSSKQRSPFPPHQTAQLITSTSTASSTSPSLAKTIPLSKGTLKRRTAGGIYSMVKIEEQDLSKETMEMSRIPTRNSEESALLTPPTPFVEPNSAPILRQNTTHDAVALIGSLNSLLPPAGALIKRRHSVQCDSLSTLHSPLQPYTQIGFDRANRVSTANAADLTPKTARTDVSRVSVETVSDSSASNSHSRVIRTLSQPQLSTIDVTGLALTSMGLPLVVNGMIVTLQHFDQKSAPQITSESAAAPINTALTMRRHSLAHPPRYIGALAATTNVARLQVTTENPRRSISPSLSRSTSDHITNNNAVTTPTSQDSAPRALLSPTAAEAQRLMVTADLHGSRRHSRDAIDDENTASSDTTVMSASTAVIALPSSRQARSRHRGHRRNKTRPAASSTDLRVAPSHNGTKHSPSQSKGSRQSLRQSAPPPIITQLTLNTAATDTSDRPKSARKSARTQNAQSNSASAHSSDRSAHLRTHSYHVGPPSHSHRLPARVPSNLPNPAQTATTDKLVEKMLSALTNDALVAFIQTTLNVLNDRALIKWANHSAIKSVIPDFSVRLFYGLHVGWAIEGAIGSIHKIDASYLSPHVNLSSRLMSACKQYGLPLLMSHSFYTLLHPVIKMRCRLVDNILMKGTAQAQLIYTFDMAIDKKHAKSRNIKLFLTDDDRHSNEERRSSSFLSGLFQQFKLLLSLSTAPPPLQAYTSGPVNSAETSNPTAAGNSVIDSVMFEALRELQSGLPRDWIINCNNAVHHYLRGEWHIAGEQMQTLMLQHTDDSSLAVLYEYMKELEFKSPADWSGVRTLSKK